jgi:hypothetical protein
MTGYHNQASHHKPARRFGWLNQNPRGNVNQ